MSDRGGLGPHQQRVADPDGSLTEAWEQTLEDMEAIAEDRREDGWEVLSVIAIHTDTVSIDMNEHDDFGLMHILPDSQAEDFEEAYDPDEFTEFLVYGSLIEGFLYNVTEFIDPEAEESILVASRIDLKRAQGLYESVLDKGVLYSHMKKVDGTYVGTFEHEEYEPLLPIKPES